MTLIWLIFGLIDEFKPVEKQQLIGSESAGFAIAIMPCLIIDCIICAILHACKVL